MTEIAVELFPKDINTKDWFWDSEFQNLETETIARNIVLIQKKINPKKWTPFSFKDYKKLCAHNVTESENGVLEALADGGKPVWNTSTALNSGYLAKDNVGNYIVTEKFIKAISKFKLD